MIDKEFIIEAINDFYGVDAMYFGVSSVDLGSYLYDRIVDKLKEVYK